jgi:hypothetical protein
MSQSNLQHVRPVEIIPFLKAEALKENSRLKIRVNAVVSDAPVEALAEPVKCNVIQLQPREVTNT